MSNTQEFNIRSIGDLQGKSILILGFGIEGKSIAGYLSKNNISFSVYDKNLEKKQELESISHATFVSKEDFQQFEVIIRSPGIHPDAQILKTVSENALITSSTKLFFDLSPTKQIIGVTGTKGKGTTSTLICEMLQEYGEDVYLGGNIGKAPFDFIDSLDQDSWVVLEMSSFQLIDLHKSPYIAVMLMTTSEHLNYHKDIYEYVEAKRNIFRFQNEDSFAIVNQDYPASSESDLAGEAKVYKISRDQEVFDEGCYIKNDTVILKINGKIKEVLKAERIKLPGKHNQENVCAAVLAASLAGVDMDSIKHVLSTFTGLEHRIEFVANIQGVMYYDDSFSTTPETAIAAIESFSQQKILILGGASKNSDFTDLGKTISNSNSIKVIIGIGEEWQHIKEVIENPHIQFIEGCETMEEIVHEASRRADVGDVVVLSPACASFGMFQNYKDRGDQFKKAVRNLTN